MPSLKERIELLEDDMRATPPRISVYHDLPFAILRYDPADEWELRREVKLLATRLEATGKEVHIIPMSATRSGTTGMPYAVRSSRTPAGASQVSEVPSSARDTTPQAAR